MNALGSWEPIAIVGVACRAAGAETADELAEVVAAGRITVTEVTPDRWAADDFCADAPGLGTGVSRWSGQLPDPYAFDADFFRISHSEAAHMDPQQRIVLEEAWHCVEDSGISLAALCASTTGVFVGVASRDHLQNAVGFDDITARTTFGGSDYMVANRVSHALGLTGASFSIDAACASSLATLHLGVRSLQLGESDYVLAGGVCVNVHPWKFISYSHAHLLSPTGRCHTLGDDADGFVSADGVVMLLLRRLEDALADGDRILGTVIASAMNSAGPRRSLTAPTAAAQEDLIRRALTVGGVDPATVGYIEMHGTGTPIGDPIEVSALRSAYAVDNRETALHIGSVKANIGHTEAAAGGLGVVKVLGMLRDGVVPPCAGLVGSNPLIPLDDRLRAARKAEPWPGIEGAPRRAAVSAFGAGGSNAHVVIEQAPPLDDDSDESDCEGFPVLVSARTPTAAGTLSELVVRAADGLRLGDVSLTLVTGRDAMTHRRGGVAHDASGLRKALAGPIRRAVSGWWLHVDGPGCLPDAEARVALDTRLREWAATDDLVARVASAYRNGDDTPETLCLHTMLVLDSLSGLLRFDGLHPRGDAWAACAQAAGVLTVGEALRATAGDTSGIEVRPARIPVAAGPQWPAARPDRVAARELLALLDGVTRDVYDLDAWLVRALEVAHTAPLVRRGLDRWRAVLGGVGWAPPENAEDLATVSWAEPRAHVVAAAACAAQLERQATRVGIPRPLYGLDDEFGALSSFLADHAGSEEVVVGWASLDAEYGPDEPFDVPGRAPVLQARREVAARETELRDLRAAVGDAGRGLLLLVPHADDDVDDLDEAAPDDAAVALPWSSSREELLPALVDAWTRGVDVEWGRWFETESRRLTRVSLPGYPFERTTLRATPPASRAGSRAASSATDPGDSQSACLYELIERWETLRLPDVDGLRDLDPQTILVCDARAARRWPKWWEEHAGLRLLHAPGGGNEGADLTDPDAWSNCFDAPHWDAARSDEGLTIVVLAVGEEDDAGGTLVDAGADEWSARVCFAAAAGSVRRRGRVRLVQIVAGRPGPAASAAHVLGPVLCRESGRVTFHQVLVPGEASEDDLRAAVRVGVSAPSPRVILGAGGARACLLEAAATAPAVEVRATPGVHIVTGGAGGLGRLVATALLRNPGVTVVLVGRSPAPPDLPAAGDGAALQYHRCDITDAAAVEQLIAEVTAELGPIRGIVHAAGVLKDAMLAGYSEADLEEVCAPKVLGLRHLDRATREQPLEYVIVCSSLAPTFGNAGQAVYAYANAALDALAVERAGLAARGERHGHCVSIQWPFWADGGMRLDASHPLLVSGALSPMPTRDGLGVLARAIDGATSPLLRVVYGDPDAGMGLLTAWTAATDAPGTAEASSEAIAVDYVRRTFAGTMGVPEEGIDLEAGLDEHGIDSIHALSFSRRVELDLGCQEPSLLFEGRSLREVASILARRQGGPLLAWGTAHRAEAARSCTSERPDTGPHGHATDGADPDGAIAVVGVAGRYPGAPDLEAFWEMLDEGTVSVRTIPEERWALWTRGARSVERDAVGRYCPTGGFLDDVDLFDPQFFRISPADAMVMDPQERLLLETVWHALEDAGIPPSTLATDGSSPTGVFVGTTTATYDKHGAAYWERGEAVFPQHFPWSLANRISSCLDLTGPSLAVDTACSSSLTALHLAVAALRRGECGAAVVGGVNLYLHPWKYDYLSRAQMVSPSGTCSAFGAAADGFVPGEGVGCLVLKPLAQARRDGDRVRAVIRGTAVGHGGRARGYTVPRPQQQATVVRAALDDAGVDPTTVGYVEAHGTGTRLGDPVEARGLADVFAREPGHPLAIGSVKPQIGHLEAAAGLAGVTKVILQFEHGVLVPSRHAQPANREIDLGAIGLEVVAEKVEWRRNRDDRGRLLPRRAGVSSFGAGGSNAHVLLEEDLPVADGAAAEAPGPHVFCLSAATEPALTAVCGRLAGWIDHHPDASPSAVAYALQVYRDALTHRVAVVARDLPALRTVLAEVAETGRADGAIRGRREAPVRAEAVRLAAGMGADAAPADRARLWADGASIDWRSFWPAPQPRVDLPLYPFEERRITLPPFGSTQAASSALAEGWSHADERVLRLAQRDPVLDEHRVRGVSILPAVAILDIVLAVARDLGLPADGIRDLVLTEPVLVTATLDLRVAVTDADAVGGRLVTVTSERSGSVRTHARCVLMTGVPAPRPPHVGIAALRSRCTTSVDPDWVYATHTDRGLQLGPGYRGVAAIHYGGRDLLARVVRPAAAMWGSGFHLHPALFDSCLQSSVVLTGSDRLRLPFAVGQCEVFGPVPDEAYSHIALTKSPAGARCFDVTIADAAGEVAVRLTDVWVRDVPDTVAGGVDGGVSAGTVHPDLPGPALAVQAWEPCPDEPEPRPIGRVVVLAGDAAGPRADSLAEALGRYDGAHVSRAGTVCLDGDARALEQALADEPAGDLQAVVLLDEAACLGPHAVDACLEMLGTVRALTSATRSAIRVLVLASGDLAGGPEADGVAALLRTAMEELSRLSAVVLRVPDQGQAGAAVAEALTRTEWPATQLRSDGAALQRSVWRPLEPAGFDPLPVNKSDAYLVVGGNGGVGRRIVEDLVRRGASAVVVASRSDSSLDSLPPDVRAAVTTVRTDVSTRDGAETAVAAARARTGRIAGVFHCAAVLEDEYVLAATPEAVRRVVAAKDDVAYWLDQACRGDDMELFCLVSSMASAIANPGQGAYAFANGWLDGFARWRSGRPDRCGETRSLLLPYMVDGGMRMPDEARHWLAHTGLGATTVAQVLEAIPAALAQPEPVVRLAPPGGPAAGQGESGRSAALGAAASAADRHAPADRIPGGASAVIEAFLIEQVAAVSMTDSAKVDPLSDLSVFGLDSISFARVASEIGTRFEARVSPAVFFEFSTIRELAAHLAEAVVRPEAVAEVAAAAASASPASPAPAAAAPTPPPVPASVVRSGRRFDPVDNAVAVIGIAGRFPGSADVDALWSNLIAGEDLITEIPEDRWDWRTVYDPEMAGPDTTNSKWGGFIPDVAEFDHAFFGISPREARLMDPQHRLFLQVAYQAIEDAGRRPSELARGRTGVFVGVASHDYFELVRASGVPLEGYSATGMFHSLLPNRLSYYLNLSGPSFPIDAACSSSLVAIHTAVESLRSGNCDTAIAGGANLLLSPTIYVAFSRAGMLSPTGRCRTFDQAADGYVRGEGIGAVLLKPLRAALADGDHIHGIIRGSAVNHGGKVNTLTTPNPKAQAALIESAMAAANVSTEDLDYVEMHGTGTPLGDPIEVNGLKRALGRRRAERADAPQSEVLIGSVKSSLGHLEAAAGMAGLFKVLLAMRHGVIPPNLHLHQLNEHIDLEGSGLRIVDRPTPWPSSTGPRTAGISSFGFGGINAHLVIQEARDLT